jgi:hypothetical protein
VQPRAIQAGSHAWRDPVKDARRGQSIDDDVQRAVADVGEYKGDDISA